MSSENGYVIEITSPIQIDGVYFIMGETYDVIGISRKIIDVKCDWLKKYCGLVNHYMIMKNDRKFLIPAPAAAFAPKMKNPETMNRAKYWIDKSQGEEVKDYVKLAFQMHGVSIAAKDSVDQADYAYQKMLEQIYKTPQRIETGQPVKVIVPEYTNVTSNEDRTKIAAGIYISVTSAVFYRGTTLAYEIGITKQPTQTVEIRIFISPADVEISEDTLYFTAENFDKIQTVLVTIPETTVLDKDKVVSLNHIAAWPGEQISNEIVSLLLKKDR